MTGFVTCTCIIFIIYLRLFLIKCFLIQLHHTYSDKNLKQQYAG